MKLRWIASVLTLAVASTLGTAAPKIGVLLKGKNNFWDSLGAGATAAATAAGAEITVKTPKEETDVSIQIRLLDIIAKQGVEAILVAPANQDSLSKPLAELAAKGVKIIAVDTFISDQYPFVGTNQKAAGEAAGKFLAGLIQEGDEVSVLRHTQQNVASGEREAGAIAKLQEAKPGIKLHSEIYSGSEPGLEGEKAALLLNKYPGTKAIFSSSTPSTMAMLHELVKRDLAGKIKFVGCGFDLNDEVINALEAGHLDAWIAQLPGLMGSKGVEAALAAIADKPVAPRIDVEIRVITKADLKDPAILALKH